MAYKADQGGRFHSDAHRRVLGHLALPDDGFGYTPNALFHRMADDVGTNFADGDEIREIILDLVNEGGYAEEPEEGVFRMTTHGLETLQMGIVDEPAPLGEGETATPVRLDAPTPLRGHVKSTSKGSVS